MGRRCGECDAEYPDSVAICPFDGNVIGERSQPRTRPSREPVFDPAEFDDGDETVSVRSPRHVAAQAATAPPPAQAPAPRPSGEIAMPTEALEPGTPVGEYRVTRALESGGMATVYAGEHPLIGKEVAIKVLSGALSSDPMMVERFVQEARAVNQIRHHNIVDIFALGQLPDGRTYCVMELLSGETLQARLRKGARPNVEDALSILSQMCDGLEAAHARQIVHRDLKPDNVFLVDTGRGLLVKLLDFGIAKLLGDEGGGRARTRAGILMGTPEYMAPEQCLGQEVDTRADVYALGVIMYEMFTGRLPFEAASALQMITAQVSSDAPDPRDSGVADDLAEIIQGCLAKEPADRLASVATVRERLVQVLDRMGADVVRATTLPPAVTGGGTTPGRGSMPTPRPTAQGRPAQPRSRVGLYIGVAALLGLAGVGAVVVFKEVRSHAEEKLLPPAAAETTELPGATAPERFDAGVRAIAPRQDPALLPGPGAVPVADETVEQAGKAVAPTTTRPEPRKPAGKAAAKGAIDAGPTLPPAGDADAGATQAAVPPAPAKPSADAAP